MNAVDGPGMLSMNWPKVYEKTLSSWLNFCSVSLTEYLLAE